MGQRADLGQNWDDVVANWCLGVKPAIPDKAAWEALDTIERLWPALFDGVVGKGIIVIAPMIDIGIMLADVEGLPGFADLLARLKQGERAARSELFLASTLVKLGYRPTIEPSLNGKKLDALISVDSDEIYFEVISPVASQVFEQHIIDADKFVKELTEQFPGTSTDIRLLDMLSDEIKHKLIAFIKEMHPSNSEEFQRMNNMALISHTLFRPEGAPFNSTDSDVKGPKLGILGFNSNARVNLVQPVMSDERLQRLLDDEAKHFSQKTINILMIDVSAVPHNFEAWGPLIQRRFQPSINRRFTAGILFRRELINTGVIHTHWNMIINQYAYKKLPQALQKTLLQLTDEGIGND